MSDDTDEVLVVAAGTAWPFYQLASAYVCQQGRSFRDTSRIAFYSHRTIREYAPLIEERIDDVVLSDATAARLSMAVSTRDRRLGDVIAAALSRAWKEGERSQVFLLTEPTDPRTASFPAVKHTGTSAWTMGQRYTRLDLLRGAASTDDLVPDKAADVR